MAVLTIQNPLRHLHRSEGQAESHRHINGQESDLLVLAGGYCRNRLREALAISAGIQDICLRLPHDPGTYMVTATPYSGAGGTGTAGTSLTVTITVVSQFLYFTDGAYAVADEHEGF